MPIFTVATNVPASLVPQDFKRRAAMVISTTLEKPESYVAVHLKADNDIYFNCSDKPAAICEVVSIGNLSVEKNKKHANKIMEFLKESLLIEPTRIYITFKNVPKGDLGFNGTTFADLM